MWNYHSIIKLLGTNNPKESQYCGCLRNQSWANLSRSSGETSVWARVHGDIAHWKPNWVDREPLQSDKFPGEDSQGQQIGVSRKNQKLFHQIFEFYFDGRKWFSGQKRRDHRFDDLLRKKWILDCGRVTNQRRTSSSVRQKAAQQNRQTTDKHSEEEQETFGRVLQRGVGTVLQQFSVWQILFEGEAETQIRKGQHHSHFEHVAEQSQKLFHEQMNIFSDHIFLFFKSTFTLFQ